MAILSVVEGDQAAMLHANAVVAVRERFCQLRSRRDPLPDGLYLTDPGYLGLFFENLVRSEV